MSCLSHSPTCTPSPVLARHILTHGYHLAVYDDRIYHKPGWTASSILRVFIRQSLRAQERTNVLTEIMYSTAIKRAKALDDQYARTGKLVGPLHGVPMSLKECVPPFHPSSSPHTHNSARTQLVFAKTELVIVQDCLPLLWLGAQSNSRDRV